MIQIFIYLYTKVIHKNITHYQNSPTISNHLSTNLVTKSVNKPLPISSEYTEWDDEKVAILNKKIEAFNRQLETKPSETRQSDIKQPETRQSTPIITQKVVTPPKKIVKLAQKTKKISPKIKSHKTKKIAKKRKTTPRISIREKIARYAKTKLGKKYVWGAVGPKSFDCSGFTRAVYKSVTGIKIPRVSRDQAKVGKYVKYQSLKCGDMVFFDTEKKFSGRVNHVGIYLSNGNFIHASSARKKVIITNFNKKPFYKRRFLWGRRVINKS